jgi:TonB family protein
MFSAARAAPLTRSGPRPQPIALSIFVHAVVLGFVIFGPLPAPRREAPSPYDQVIRPREKELVWYSFNRNLPDVTPLESRSAHPPGAELRMRDQTIVSNPRKGDRGAQMIWRPAPQIKPQLEIVSPNMLAFQRLLLPPPPPGPPPKLFVPPRPANPVRLPVALLAPPPVQVRVGLRTSPFLQSQLSAALEIRPRVRDFVPPAPRMEQRAAPVALPEAPSVASSLRSSRVPLLAENMAAPLANKPQAPKFVPPPTAGRSPASPAPLPDAPKVSTHLAYGNGTTTNPAVQNASGAALAGKPEPRRFVPPPAGGGGNGPPTAPAPPIEDAPSSDLDGVQSASLNVAIVGLNPAARLNGPLPDSSRDARFSAGPTADGNAGGADAASTAALSIPGLLIRGGQPHGAAPADPLVVARAAPTSREMLQAAMRAANPAPRSDQPSTEIRLAPPPDPAFHGREVYSLAVQMPNISSYVGSWIMWFAERDRAPRGSRGLRPPVPLHKVDPKYLPALIAERVEGKVQIAGVIRVDGRVDLLRILKGVDPRLDSSAQEALLKWEFAPAERNGIPVEVDLVAEIPFLLAPQAKR